MSKSILICIVIFLMSLTISVSHALPSDNFDDNSMDTTLWYLYEPSSYEWVDETSGRLEMRSTTSAEEIGAYYVANGWGFSTTKDFSFRADFHYSLITGAPGSTATVTLGLGKDWNNDIILEAESYVDGPQEFYYEHNIDGIEINSEKKTRTINDGILYISYDASIDELYLSDTGYWSSNAWVTIPNLLQGTWGGDIMRPFLGGCSRGGALFSGDAYLDNFIVDSGKCVFTPSLSGWVWMEGSNGFGYSLDEGDLVYFVSFGPILEYNITTGQWVDYEPAGWIYIDWPFFYDLDTNSLMFALPPESGLWVFHFSTGEWELLPRIIPW